MHAVILDTGEFRGIGDDRFAELIEAEKSLGIDPRVDSWTLMELLAHLANKSDPDYSSARAAIRRLCLRSSRSPTSFPIIAPAEVQFARMMYDARLPDLESSIEEMVRVARFVAAAGDDLTDVQPELEHVAEHVAAAESVFVEVFGSMRHHVETASYDAEGEGKSKNKWIKDYVRSPEAHRLDAIAIAQRTARQVGHAPEGPFSDGMLDRIQRANRASSFAVALAVEKIVCDKAHLEKDGIRNLIWDQEIACNIGQVVGGKSVLVVTRDKIFRSAALEAGFPSAVVNRDEYFQLLGIKGAA